MSDTQNDTSMVVRRASDLAAINELEKALLEGKAPVEVDRDPEDVSREIIAQLLSAESDEELERLEAEGWGDFVGIPFEVLDFVWRPSSFDEGQPVFLVVRAIKLDDGSPHVLTTGSGQVMAQLANLAKRDRLPAIRELAEATTKSQRSVFWLKSPDSVAEARRAEALAARAGGGVDDSQPAPGDA
jgi:hypothetical protein